MSISVLVTGAGALLGQGILKALRMSTAGYRIVAADLSPKAVGLYLADRAHLLPRFTAPGYVEAVIALARAEQVAAILCGTDLEVGVLARHRARIEAESGALLIVSAPETVAIADDKWLTAEFLRQAGFDHPRSALAPDAAALADAIGYPLIAKPRNGAGSIGLSKVNDRAELDLALRAPDMVVQECLLPDEEEYTVGTLVFDGRCVAAVALRRTLRFGNTHTAIAGEFPEICAFAARVAERLPGAFGPVNLQLRATPRGPVVFEVNARFSGTTPLRAEMGFNEVEATLRHLLERAPIPRATLRPGLVLRWTAEVIVPLDQLERLTADGALAAPAGELVGAPGRAAR